MAVMQASEASINFVKTRLASPDGKLWGKAPGMVLLKPTSIAYSGTSATLSENGQVQFSGISSFSLNGIFSNNFDNYIFSLRHYGLGGNANIDMRFRYNGTDASGADYTRQYLYASGTSVSSLRISSETKSTIGRTTLSGYGGDTVFIYGPALSQPTSLRNINVNAISGAAIEVDQVYTHSLSNQYDGVTIYLSSNTMTGALQVYGVRS